MAQYRRTGVREITTPTSQLINCLVPSLPNFRNNIQTSTTHNLWLILQILDGAPAVWQDPEAVLIRAVSLIESTICDESMRNLSTNNLMRLFGDYKFAYISNQLREANGICKWLDICLVRNYGSRASIYKAREDPHSIELLSLQFLQVSRKFYLKDLTPVFKDWPGL
ncbi:hypothetical protein TNCV_2281751 [Trichonephila clavipes]|nr:hypothetical protein TNCV_2281751 [Trichonephila clavipes]